MNKAVCKFCQGQLSYCGNRAKHGNNLELWFLRDSCSSNLQQGDVSSQREAQQNRTSLPSCPVSPSQESHTGTNAAEPLHNAATMWNTSEKDAGLIRDDAGNTVVVAQLAVSFSHIKCYVHTHSLSSSVRHSPTFLCS